MKIEVDGNCMTQAKECMEPLKPGKGGKTGSFLGHLERVQLF